MLCIHLRRVLASLEYYQSRACGTRGVRTVFESSSAKFIAPAGHEMAEWTGLEPATSGVTGRRSNQLNYHSQIWIERWVRQSNRKERDTMLG